MNITLRDGLPFVGVTLTHRGQSIALQSVLLDTGSAGTVLAADRVFKTYETRWKTYKGADFV